MSDHPIDPILCDRGLDEMPVVGCEESQLFMNRRSFMGLSAGLFSWAMMPRIASAAGAADPRILIVLLRGGMDGLSVLPNTGDSNYASMRRRLALSGDKILPINVPGYPGYQLNAYLPRFKAMMDAGEAKVVLPIAPPLRTRSHFDCSYKGIDGYDDPLSRLHRASGETELARQLALGLDTNALATGGNVKSTFAGAARLLSADTGPRFAVAVVNNFDCHVGGADANGKGALAPLDDALGVFKDAIGDVWSKTVVLAVTEFGRTVTENGNGGCDHGIGTAALLAGGALNKGTSRIIGEWPTLDVANLDINRDVRALYDTRELFKCVLREHFDVPAGVLAEVFPDSTGLQGISGLVA